MIRLNERSSKPLKKYNSKTLRGTFAELDTWNQNGRMYPKDIYEASLAEVQDKIKAGQFLGELDHPEYDEVKLQNASHVIRECKIEGSKVVGEVEILDTPAGQIVQALLEAGVPIGISSRAFGDVNESQGGDVVTELQLITFDIVADPSFSNAVLTESNKRDMNKKLDQIKKNIPLRESKSSRDICKKINKIKTDYKLNESNNQASLIAELGKQTILERKSKDLNRKLIIKNNSLRDNMQALQDGYNKLYKDLSRVSESYDNVHRELDRMKESKQLSSQDLYERDQEIIHLEEEILKLETELDRLQENCQRLSESKHDEVLDLKKELAIEKRGLNKRKIMPLLENAHTDREIEQVLDSINNFGGKRSKGYSDKAIQSLTENTEPNRANDDIKSLANLISRV